MATLQEHAAEVDRIMAQFHGELVCNSEREARAALLRVRQAQKELAFVRKFVNADMAQIRGSYAASKAHVGSGAGAILGAGFFGRKTMGRLNTVHRQDLRSQEVRALAPYEQLKAYIDTMVLNLDRAKMALQDFLL